MSFISQFLEATKEAETPRPYLFWSALATISAVCAPNVYLNCKGLYELNPHLYVFLVGESGVGKGFPIAVAKRLVKVLDCTRLIIGRNSIQAVIMVLADQKAKTTKNNPKPVAKFPDSRGFLVSGELSTFLLKDPDALTALTDLYDTHYNEDWPNTLKNSPIEVLKKPNLTFLAGSSPAHLRDTIPTVNIEGGLMSRTLMVYSDEMGKIDPLTEDAEPISYDFLAEPLRKLVDVKGKFIWGTAKEPFEKWYMPFRGTKRIVSKTGIHRRMPDHVRKVSMLLTLDRKMGEELVIDKEEFEAALELCMELTANTERIIAGKGLSDIAAKTRVVLEHLTSNGFEITRKKLLQMGWGDYDSFDLDKIKETLIDAGFCRVKQEGKNEVWRVTEEGQSQWQNYMERKR